MAISKKSSTFAPAFWKVKGEKVKSEKTDIIKTAGELFFRLGIRSVSIDDICHELGMSKKTFYVYFASKEELIEQTLQANLDYIAGKLQSLLELGDFRQLVKVFLKRQEEEINNQISI